MVCMSMQSVFEFHMTRHYQGLIVGPQVLALFQNNTASSWPTKRTDELVYTAMDIKGGTCWSTDCPGSE